MRDIYLYSLTALVVALTFISIHQNRQKAVYIPTLTKQDYIDSSIINAEIKTLPENPDKKVKIDRGEASYYDYDYPRGSGNWVTKHSLVSASRDYPRGSILRVCSDKDCVIVKVTDFGPEEWTNRIIDMGSLSFSKICSLRRGVCQVTVECLSCVNN